jgi:predicted TIM-barrel fold metal-dependent hydrolase
MAEGRGDAAAAERWAPLVDTHAHIFLRDLPLVSGATHRPEKSFTTADYLAVLDAHGVQFGVIAAPSFLGSYNDYMLDELPSQPRLRGTAIVEPDTDRYILRAMADEGVVGIRFSLRRYPTLPDLKSPEYQRLLRRVADLDWHVHIFAEDDRLATLTPILVESGVKLVIDHFGAPDAARGFDAPGFQATLRAIAKGRTWVKLSAAYRLDKAWDAGEVARKLLAEAGPERLLWASDCPFTGHEDTVTYRSTVDAFESWIPDRAVRERIGHTALRLYGFV